MKDLKEWVYSKRGNMSRLAEALNVTQPAVTKFFSAKKTILPIRHAEVLMKATGLPARSIYPEYYDLFKDVGYVDEAIRKHDELADKAKKVIDGVNDLEKSLLELSDNFNELMECYKEINNSNLD